MENIKNKGIKLETIYENVEIEDKQVIQLTHDLSVSNNIIDNLTRIINKKDMMIQNLQYKQLNNTNESSDNKFNKCCIIC
jgi:hypothetical protein